MVEVVGVVLATWRATHLVVDDDFPPIRWLRDRLQGGPGWLGDLVGCRWCASVWVAAAITAAADWWVGLARPVLVWAAAAALTPPLAALSDRLHAKPADPSGALAYLQAAVADLTAATAEHRRHTESPERVTRRPPPPEGQQGG
jgi:Protein of unknown function (DUF1360)